MAEPEEQNIDGQSQPTATEESAADVVLCEEPAEGEALDIVYEEEETASDQEVSLAVVEPGVAAPSAAQRFRSAVFTALSRLKPRKPKAKTVGIVAAATLGLAAVGVYAAGVVHFSQNTLPGTQVGDLSVSHLTAEDATAVLDEAAASYTCSISGDDYYLLVRGSDVDYRIDSAACVDAILGSSDRFLWPFKLKGTNTYDLTPWISWDDNALSAAIRTYTEPHNEGVSQSEDAYAGFSVEADCFAVIPEVIGKAYDVAKVQQTTQPALATMQSHVSLPQDNLFLPNVYADDQGLLATVDECNDLLGADFDVTVTDTWTKEYRVLDHIGNQTVSQWIAIDEEGHATFDDEAMVVWCTDYCISHDTYGTTRTYTRPDGEVITIGGGTYGWNIYRQSFIDRLTTAIREKSTDDVVVPCSQTAAVWTDADHPNDFGDSYVDITISTQTVRYYVNGELVIQCGTVSGDFQTGQQTPYGVFYVSNKLHPTHLKGNNLDGTPYDVPVDYWMAFIENHTGLHDNPNRSAFGLPWAFVKAGSHGCCNLPYWAAKQMYYSISLGDPVIVHW